VGLLTRWVIRVPYGCVVIACSRNHYCSHDSGDIECWPLGHKVVKQSFFAKACLSLLSNALLHCDSSRVVNGVWLVPIRVGLNQKPCIVSECVKAVNAVAVSLDNSTFISLSTTDDIVYWTTNASGLQPLQCILISNLFL
jgi:hypothetical protein